MKCKECGEELQKIPILGNTKGYQYYCVGCFNNGKTFKECHSPTFKEKESWRSKLNGHQPASKPVLIEDIDRDTWEEIGHREGWFNE